MRDDADKRTHLPPRDFAPEEMRMSGMSARNRRIAAFVDFCIEHQVKISVIMWLLIIMAGVAYYKAAY